MRVLVTCPPAKVKPPLVRWQRGKNDKIDAKKRTRRKFAGFVLVPRRGETGCFRGVGLFANYLPE
jgi:hypothetical protein